MDKTEFLIPQPKNEPYTKLTFFLTVFFVCFGVSCAFSYLLGNILPHDGYYLIGHYAETDSFFGIIKTIISRVTPSAIEITVLYLSAYTVHTLPVSCILILFRGASFGYTASLLKNTVAVGSTDSWEWVLGLGFLSAVLISVLCAYSCVYSLMLSRAYFSEDKKARHSLSISYTRFILMIAGGIFVTQFISAMIN